jgi:hypothetical protein
MIIRCQIVGGVTEPFRVDLPTYSMIADNPAVQRALVDVPVADVPSGVAAFVAAYPVLDLVTPLPVPFPASLANAWAEHLARQYDLGNARWHPVVF